MSDKHPEIECYECGRLKTRLIWNSRCVTCTVRRLEVNLEENDNLRVRLADLEEENERLKILGLRPELLICDDPFKTPEEDHY